jgi:hypothetical protein
MKWRVKEPTIPEIKGQLLEPMPLPMGRQEFEEWSDRIIAGALITADKDSIRFALANMILTLGPTESHKPDAYFIHSLRKVAVNQVADAIRCEIRDAAKARLAKEEEATLKLVPNESKILADPGVQNPPSGVGSQTP